jgi:hypothetical protein
MEQDYEDDDEFQSSYHTMGPEDLASRGQGDGGSLAGITKPDQNSRDVYSGAVNDFLTNTSAASGASIEESDRERLNQYHDSFLRGETTQGQLDEFNNRLTTQYNQRGASGGGGAAPRPGGGAVQQQVSGMQSRLASGDPADRDYVSRELQNLLTSQGHDVKWEGANVMIDGRPYTIGGSDPSKEWMPTGKSGYTPGAIGTEDIPDFTYDSLLQQMGDPQMDSFMSSLMANPESLDARTIESMKGRSKDELSEMDAQNREMLGGLGTSYGISESPWMAKQQMKASTDRDAALIGSNRNIDIEAARTNAGDRRAVAGLGLQHGAQKQNKVMGAASAALQKSAAMGDRLALRESVDQQAAALGMRAEEILANHVQQRLSQMTDMFRINVGSSDSRFGTKVNALTNLDIQSKDLAQADRHFLEELSMKMEELAGLNKERDRGQVRWEEEHELEKRKQKKVEEVIDWEYTKDV